jgi:hypothetical protein
MTNETTNPRKCGGCDRLIATKVSATVVTIDGAQMLANVFVPHLAHGALCCGSNNVAALSPKAGL